MTDYTAVLKKVWEIRRRQGNDTPWNKNSKKPSKATLIKLHFKENKNLKEIAIFYGSKSNTPVRRWFKEYGLKPKVFRNYSLTPGYEQTHHNWKGDKAKYQAMHAWVRSRKGTPKECEHCKDTTKKKYEWANLDHSYKRNLDDYIRLCTSCHRKYDKAHN